MKREQERVQVNVHVCIDSSSTCTCTCTCTLNSTIESTWNVFKHFVKYLTFYLQWNQHTQIIHVYMYSMYTVGVSRSIIFCTSQIYTLY